MGRVVLVARPVAVIAVLSLVGCGSSSAPSTPPASRASEKAAIREVLPPATRTRPRTRASGAAQRPSPRSSTRAGARVLSGPLVLRLPGRHPGTGEPLDPGYVVFFRTSGPFVRHDDVGTTVPGDLRVEDAEDDHDGYAGAIGDGTTTGKCYEWTISAPSPALDATRIGTSVRTTVALPRTAPRSRSTTLKAYPGSEAHLSALLRGIGCAPRSG